MVTRKSMPTVLLIIAWLLLLSCYSFAVTLPFFEDFESYSKGSYPGKSGWKMWLSGQSAYVSDIATYGGIRSFRLQSYNYWSRCDYLPIDQMPDRLSYQFSFYMDPVAGRSAHAGLVYGAGNSLQFFNHFIINSGNGLVGSIQFQGANNLPPVEVGQSQVGRWITLGTDLDFARQTADLWLNEQLILLNVPIQPRDFDDPIWTHVTLNKFAVRECNWIGARFGTIYVDDVAIFETPVPTITATVDMDPDTLNLRSNGRWVTCYIELPEDYSAQDIDVTSLLLQGEISAEPRPVTISDYDSDGIPELMVKFDRASLAATLTPGPQIIVLSGELFDGTPLEGSATIRVKR